MIEYLFPFLTMAMIYHKKIWGKSFRHFFTTKPKREETRWGLSLSYDIITKEHNGIITVDGKEGRGGECIIRMPLKN